MASKEARINVTLDPSQAKRGIEQILASFKKLQQIADSTSRFMEAASKTFATNFLKSHESFVKSLTKLKKNVQDFWKGLTTALGAFKKGLQNVLSVGNGLAKWLLPASVTMLTRSFITAGIEMQRFTTTMQVITGDVATARAELDWLMSTANKLGVAFESTAAPFAKFSAAAAEIFDAQEIRDIFEAFMMASSAMVMTKQEVFGVTLAIQQMASKGRVSMEELRLQLAERIPGAMQIAADSMDVSVKNLEDQVRRGALATEDFLGAFADGLRDKFANAAAYAATTAVGAINQLENAMFDARRTIAEGGLMEGLNQAARLLTSYLQGSQEELRRFGQLLGNLAIRAAEWATSITAEDVAGFIGTINNALAKTAGFFKWIQESRGFQLLFGDPRLDEMLAAYDKLKAKQQEILNYFDRIKGKTITNPEMEEALARKNQELDSISRAMTALGAAIEKVKNGSEGMIRPISVAADEVERINKGVEYYLAGIEEQGQRVRELLNPVSTLTKLRQREAELLTTIKRLNEQISAADTTTVEGAKQAWDLARKKTNAYQALLDIQEQISEELETQNSLVEKHTSYVEQLRRKYNDTYAITQDFAQEMREINELASIDNWSPAQVAEAQAAAIERMYDALDGGKKKTEEVKDEFDSFTTIIEESVKRIDGAFIDMWRDFIDGGKNALDSFKSLFKNLLAELAHAAITKPIVLGITGAMGFGGSSAAAATSGSGASGLTSLASVFTGNSIGMGISDAAAWLGTSTPLAGTGAGNALTGMAGNAGAYSNLAYGVAGFAGGFVGDALFGGYGGTGGSIGATIGMAAAGPIGAVIGTVLGGAIGGMFGDKTDPRLGFGDRSFDSKNFEDGVFYEGPFSRVGYRGASHGMAAGDENFRSLLEGVVALDQMLANLMTSDEIARTSDFLQNAPGRNGGEKYGHGLDTSLVDLSEMSDEKIAALMVERINFIAENISGAAGEAIRSFISNFSGTVEELSIGIANIAGSFEAINVADLDYNAFKFLEAFIKDFDGDMSTLASTVVPLAQALQLVKDVDPAIAGVVEAMMQNFDGATEEFVGMAEALSVINEQLGTDTLEVYAEQAKLANRNLTETWGDQVIAVYDLMAALDGSAASYQNLAAANSSRIQMELQMFAALDAAAKSISQTLGSTIERIKLDMMDQDGQYNYLRSSAEDLAASLNDMVDPARITETVNAINAMTTQAWGLLDDQQKNAMGGEFLTFLTDVETLSQAKLDEARTMVIDESERIRQAIVEAMGNAARDFSGAASEMSGAASQMTAAAARIPNTITVRIADSEVNA